MIRQDKHFKATKYRKSVCVNLASIENYTRCNLQISLYLTSFQYSFPSIPSSSLLFISTCRTIHHIPLVSSPYSFHSPHPFLSMYASNHQHIDISSNVQQTVVHFSHLPHNSHRFLNDQFFFRRADAFIQDKNKNKNKYKKNEV